MEECPWGGPLSRNLITGAIIPEVFECQAASRTQDFFAREGSWCHSSASRTLRGPNVSDLHQPSRSDHF